MERLRGKILDYLSNRYDKEASVKNFIEDKYIEKMISDLLFGLNLPFLGYRALVGGGEVEAHGVFERDLNSSGGVTYSLVLRRGRLGDENKLRADFAYFANIFPYTDLSNVEVKRLGKMNVMEGHVEVPLEYFNKDEIKKKLDELKKMVTLIKMAHLKDPSKYVEDYISASADLEDLIRRLRRLGGKGRILVGVKKRREKEKEAYDVLYFRIPPHIEDIIRSASEGLEPQGSPMILVNNEPIFIWRIGDKENAVQTVYYPGRKIKYVYRRTIPASTGTITERRQIGNADVIIYHKGNKITIEASTYDKNLNLSELVENIINEIANKRKSTSMKKTS